MKKHFSKIFVFFKEWKEGFNHFSDQHNGRLKIIRKPCNLSFFQFFCYSQKHIFLKKCFYRCTPAVAELSLKWHFKILHKTSKSIIIISSSLQIKHFNHFAQHASWFCAYRTLCKWINNHFHLLGSHLIFFEQKTMNVTQFTDEPSQKITMLSIFFILFPAIHIIESNIIDFALNVVSIFISHQINGHQFIKQRQWTISKMSQTKIFFPSPHLLLLLHEQIFDNNFQLRWNRWFSPLPEIIKFIIKNNFSFNEIKIFYFLPFLLFTIIFIFIL